MTELINKMSTTKSKLPKENKTIYMFSEIQNFIIFVSLFIHRICRINYDLNIY